MVYFIHTQVSYPHLYHNSQINISSPYVSLCLRSYVNTSTYLKSPLTCPKVTRYSNCRKLNALAHIHHIRASPCVLSPVITQVRNLGIILELLFIFIYPYCLLSYQVLMIPPIKYLLNYPLLFIPNIWGILQQNK